MGFFTEMFARPRPQEHQRYRSALALLHSMSNADRADIGIKPADFPRIAREMTALIKAWALNQRKTRFPGSDRETSKRRIPQRLPR